MTELLKLAIRDRNKCFQEPLRGVFCEFLNFVLFCFKAGSHALLTTSISYLIV